MPVRVINVEIHGQRYAIRSELDPQYIGELAAFLDEKMQAAAVELSSPDPLRIAVIAAMNIADELARTRDTSTGIEGRLLSRAADIERIVDAVLDEARIRAVNE